MPILQDAKGFFLTFLCSTVVAWTAKNESRVSVCRQFLFRVSPPGNYLGVSPVTFILPLHNDSPVEDAKLSEPRMPNDIKDRLTGGNAGGVFGFNAHGLSSCYDMIIKRGLSQSTSG